MAMGATRVKCMALPSPDFSHPHRWIHSGIVLTEMVGRTARTLLYGVRETDPWALLLAICVLGVSGLLATLIPARGRHLWILSRLFGSNDLPTGPWTGYCRVPIQKWSAICVPLPMRLKAKGVRSTLEDMRRRHAEKSIQIR